MMTDSTTRAAGPGEARQRGLASRPSPLASLRLWLDEDGQAALATVIETWGSAPVQVGGVMAIATDGRFEGSVSGGCIEGEIIAEAADVLSDGRPRTLAFGVADETAWGAGLPCGGKVRVLLERLDRERHAGLVRSMSDVAARRSGLVLRKTLATAEVRVIPLDSGPLDSGPLADDLATRVASNKSGLTTEPDGEVFWHVVLPPARIVIVGASHISQAVAGFARSLGYECHVVDPRTAFATPDRFPGVRLHTDWPEAALTAIGLDAYTAIAVLAHVDHIDDEALTAAFRSDARYIGALGSKRTHSRRVERLTAAGVSAADLARIKNPIGLDIGAATPEEIALSVMAEIVAAVRKPGAARIG
jgi:xanthine dehydrogenase accessory factor